MNDSLKAQVNGILHAKIKRLAVSACAAANPLPGKRHRKYTLPACAETMVAMLGRIETATNDELESFAHFATTGEVRELVKHPAP